MALSMRDRSLIVRYGTRFLVREWRRFVLPVFSLCITTVVLLTTLLVTSSSSALLTSKSTALLGGDAVLESASAIKADELLAQSGVIPQKISSTIEFSSSLQSDAAVVPVSIEVVDKTYPLYGEVTLQEGSYSYPTDNEVLLEAKAAEKLAVKTGDEVTLGTSTYRVMGIIAADPSALLRGFSFFPRVIMSSDGFMRAGIDQKLLRAEYKYSLSIPNITSADMSALHTLEKNSNGFIQVHIATENKSGLQTGLAIVKDFLVIAVLITVVLAAVNVYASTLYFIASERRSLAILLSLGLTKRQVVGVLAVTLALVVFLAGVVGTLMSVGAMLFITQYVEMNFSMTLPPPEFLRYIALTIVLLLLLTVSAFAPTVQNILGLSPKQLLIGEEKESRQGRGLLITIITACTFLPVLAVSIVLLESWKQGVLAIGALTAVYVGIALIFAGILQALYVYRARFSFSSRLIISQKKADGLFGIISFTSLFVALTVLVLLLLLQSTLERYLTNDLSNTVPSTYVIDVQPSQQTEVLRRFPELELFANVPARIVAIDNLEIQQAIADGNPNVDRELGREFNLTPRETLLKSETVTSGVWQGSNAGEVSVDEDFAKRANIHLGSKILFGIQGFEVESTVTSLRKTDSRSGLPFFYFVLSPSDIGKFPSVYFGYAYIATQKQNELIRFLATNMPNVTVLDTKAIAPLILALSSALLTVVFVVTLPPIIIAILLIVTMIISAYRIRRRESGRLQALGATKSDTTKWYVTETLSLTAAAAVLSYIAGSATNYFVATYYLKVSTVVWFTPFLVFGFTGILVAVTGIAVWLIKRDTMPLRELLSYES